MGRFQDSPAINFEDYRYFLKDSQFLVLENIDLVKLEEVSWMICGSRYEKRAKKVLDHPEVYKMWRIFNFFAEPGEFPVVLDPQVTWYKAQMVFLVLLVFNNEDEGK